MEGLPGRGVGWEEKERVDVLKVLVEKGVCCEGRVLFGGRRGSG